MLVRLARSGDIARIAKTTGHDFLFVDAQHALFNVETIGHIAQTALGLGIAPLVRVRSCDDPDTQVLLDNGVTGIVFPDVNTAAQAKRAVDRAKFPPIGKRSVGGALSDFRFSRAQHRGHGPGAQRQHAGRVHDRNEGRPRERRGDRGRRRRRRGPRRLERSAHRARPSRDLRQPRAHCRCRPRDGGRQKTRQSVRLRAATATSRVRPTSSAKARASSRRTATSHS